MGLVKTQKETKPARGTYTLERAKVGASQDTEMKRASEVHLHTREVRGQGWSGQRKKASQPGALTIWRVQKLIPARTETKCTHHLERAEVGASQDMEIKRASKVYLLTGEVRGQGWLGYRKKASQPASQPASQGHSHTREYRC